MACLETSFIVDLFRGNKEAVDFLGKIKRADEQPCVASPTIMEMVSNASLNMKKNEKEDILEFISGLEILPLDKESAIKAGEIEAELIMGGEVIEDADIMIAAVAITNNETLVTRNKKHFERIKGLRIESY